MKKLNKLFILLLIFTSFAFSQQVEIKSKSTAVTNDLFEHSDIFVGSMTDSTDWFDVWSQQVFSGYFDIDPAKDTTSIWFGPNYVTQLDIAIQYELDWHREWSDASGYWPLGYTSRKTVATITAADTSNQGRHYFSFHLPSSIAPVLAKNMRLFLVSGATSDSVSFKNFRILKQP